MAVLPKSLNYDASPPGGAAADSGALILAEVFINNVG